MKAAVLHEHLSSTESLRYQEMSDPLAQKPKDLTIRGGSAAFCRTDLHTAEGIWHSKGEVALPYTADQVNAGWVEAIGSGVEFVKVGHSVICDTQVTRGHCLSCRRGDDMLANDNRFPGPDAGHAECLHSGERSLIKRPETLAPKDVAPDTNAGLTAYHAAKKAFCTLMSGEAAGRPAHRHHRHADDIGCAVLCFHRPFERGPDLLRAEGNVAIAAAARCETRTILVGRHLDKVEVREGLALCQADP